MTDDDRAIRDQVRQRFGRVARDPGSETRFELGRASAVRLGYDAEALDAIPAEALASFAGVGNPLAIEPLSAGMTVLDLGCGSGVDTIIASRVVRPGGRVIGIDMTEAMVEKAADACARAGCDNVEIRVGLAHDVALDDESVDVVISNGVINLCPDKPSVVAEIHRLLRPGGRVQLADMSLVEGVNPELLERVGEWSD
jgi:2-polyprenyl-3-methyl-5-hydroxy-6-metoxy-1,4-benzoquinol methylase